ncbi:DNA mismatch repair protein MutT [Candidatus Atribacteria bacterium HGW-Atribacteria-1]|nr:MAG: DNA mismatch repair protein MutT [Candidatus Atribacteria bacterium HGW-Atribacteria-1]
MLNENKLEKHFTVSALIINKEGKILLINHRKLGIWLYPGGHIEQGETPDEAVVREVKEETGLNVKIISDKDDTLSDSKADVYALHNPYVILCEKINTINRTNEHYHIDLAYLCKIDCKEDSEIYYNPRESCGIGFFGLEDLYNINLFPNFRKLLEKVFKQI